MIKTLIVDKRVDVFVIGNAAQNVLINKGVKKVYNLSGGHKHYSKIHSEK